MAPEDLGRLSPQHPRGPYPPAHLTATHPEAWRPGAALAKRHTPDRMLSSARCHGASPHCPSSQEERASTGAPALRLSVFAAGPCLSFPSPAARRHIPHPLGPCTGVFPPPPPCSRSSALTTCCSPGVGGAALAPPDSAFPAPAALAPESAELSPTPDPIQALRSRCPLPGHLPQPPCGCPLPGSTPAAQSARSRAPGAAWCSTCSCAPARGIRPFGRCAWRPVKGKAGSLPPGQGRVASTGPRHMRPPPPPPSWPFRLSKQAAPHRAARPPSPRQLGSLAPPPNLLLTGQVWLRSHRLHTDTVRQASLGSQEGEASRRFSRGLPAPLALSPQRRVPASALRRNSRRSRTFGDTFQHIGQGGTWPQSPQGIRGRWCCQELGGRGPSARARSVVNLGTLGCPLKPSPCTAWPQSSVPGEVLCPQDDSSHCA